MTKCFFCDTEMIIQSEYDFEEVGLDGEGRVIVLTCPICDAFAEFSLPEKEGEKIIDRIK